MANWFQSVLRRFGGTRRYNRDGVKMSRINRDAYKYTENGRDVIVQIEVQNGNPDYIIYAGSIERWLPPYAQEEISQVDKDRIITNIGQFIEYYGETFVVR